MTELFPGISPTELTPYPETPEPQINSPEDLTHALDFLCQYAFKLMDDPSADKSVTQIRSFNGDNIPFVDGHELTSDSFVNYIEITDRKFGSNERIPVERPTYSELPNYVQKRIDNRINIGHKFLPRTKIVVLQYELENKAKDDQVKNSRRIVAAYDRGLALITETQSPKTGKWEVTKFESQSVYPKNIFFFFGFDRENQELYREMHRLIEERFNIRLPHSPERLPSVGDKPYKPGTEVDISHIDPNITSSKLTQFKTPDSTPTPPVTNTPNLPRWGKVIGDIIFGIDLLDSLEIARRKAAATLARWSIASQPDRP